MCEGSVFGAVNRYACAMSDSVTVECSFEPPFQLGATLSIVSMGAGDPCLRIDSDHRARIAFPGANGPTAIELVQEFGSVRATLAGPDAEVLAETIPSMLGFDFIPPTFDGPTKLRRIATRFAGMRLCRIPVLYPRIVQTILQQLISFTDATQGWRRLVRKYGTPIAAYDDLIAPPNAEALSRLPSYDYTACGILPQHARRIIAVAREARRIEPQWAYGTNVAAIDQICLRLRQVRGIGPWTIGFVRGMAMGDGDAFVPGDYNHPKHVSYFFDEQDYESATDEDLARLLDPFRPSRFYVLLLLMMGAKPPPRKGPKGQLLRDRIFTSRGRR